MQYNKEKRKEYWEKNKDRLNAGRNIRNKLLSPEIKDERRAKAKKYREKNKEKIRLKRKLYTVKNWETIYQKKKEYKAKKIKEDPDFFKRKMREIWKKSSKIRETDKKWKKLNKEKMLKSVRKTILKHPEKHEARKRFNAIRYSKFRNIIPLPCEICGEIKTEAHHDDYSKPFEIRWLCKIHHMEFHRIHIYDTKNYTYIKKETC